MKTLFAWVAVSSALTLNAGAADQNYNFEGIARLPVCSGSLVQLEHAKGSDPALLLTNGHCTGQIAPGAFDYEKPVHPHPLPVDILAANGDSAGRTVSYKILYATMTGTDLALYELVKTYDEIEADFHVQPLQLSSARPQLNAALEVLSGYVHAGYSCSIEAFVDQLKEDQWTDADSMRYSRPGCDVVGGTSGSPVVLAGTRTVVGVNNTKNENGEQCTDNNPCEIDGQGHVIAEKGYAYAQQTYLIYSCVNSSGTFDLSTPGCLLQH